MNSYLVYNYENNSTEEFVTLDNLVSWCVGMDIEKLAFFKNGRIVDVLGSAEKTGFSTIAIRNVFLSA